MNSKIFPSIRMVIDHHLLASLSLFLNQDMCNGEDGTFRVLVENEACGIVGHRCGKAVTVFFQGGWIVMQDGEVTQRNLILPLAT